MTNFNSPEAILRSIEAEKAFLMTQLGFYAWEFVLTFWFEWSIFTGQRKWRWAMLLYFIARYSVVAADTANTVFVTTALPVNCQAAVSTAIAFAALVHTCASGVFVLRTVAVWGMNKYVVFSLGLIWLGQSATWFHSTVSVTTQFSTTANACIVTAEGNWLWVTYAYTEIVDTLTLVLTMYKLFRSEGSGTRYSIGRILIQQGLIYFIVSFAASTFALLMVLLRLNDVLYLIGSQFGLTVSGMAACRAFIHLSTNSAIHDSDEIYRSRSDGFNNMNPGYRRRTGLSSRGGSGRVPGLPSAHLRSHESALGPNGDGASGASGKAGLLDETNGVNITLERTVHTEELAEVPHAHFAETEDGSETGPKTYAHPFAGYDRSY